jgi:CheY-like chemotaxis protein
MRVLIIDDEEDIRTIARLCLGRVGGMEVIDASNGMDGITLASEHRPDVILLDVMLPTMDGPATFRELQKNPDTASIPVIFLTAKAMASELEKLQATGVAGVLTKPFDPMALPAQVRAILGVKQK